MQKSIIIHTLIENEKGEILILQRSKEDTVLPGFWDISGGTLEDGEDPITGAIRETREEVGLDIFDPKIFYCESNVDVTKDKQYVTLIFSAKCEKPEVILSLEHQKFAWIKPSEIGRYKTVRYLDFKGCLASYKK